MKIRYPCKNKSCTKGIGYIARMLDLDPKPAMVEKEGQYCSIECAVYDGVFCVRCGGRKDLDHPKDCKCSCHKE